MIQKEIVTILSGVIHFGRSGWLGEEREKPVRQASSGPNEPLGLQLQYVTVVLARETGII